MHDARTLWSPPTLPTQAGAVTTRGIYMVYEYTHQPLLRKSRGHAAPILSRDLALAIALSTAEHVSLDHHPSINAVSIYKYYLVLLSLLAIL